jgi:hypothetical protein
MVGGETYGGQSQLPSGWQALTASGSPGLWFSLAR